MKVTRRYDIPLLPAIKLMQEAEAERATRARKDKNKKVRTMPVRFLSVNRMYGTNRHGRGGRYLRSEGEVYKDYIADTLALVDKNTTSRVSGEHFECSYVFFMTHEMLYLKNGNPRQDSGTDVSNLLKAVEDSLFEYLGANDCKVVSVRGYKRLTVGDPRIVVLASPASLEDPIHHAGQSVDPLDLEYDGSLLQTNL